MGGLWIDVNVLEENLVVCQNFYFFKINSGKISQLYKMLYWRCSVCRYFSVIYSIYKVKDGPVMNNVSWTEEYD